MKSSFWFVSLALALVLAPVLADGSHISMQVRLLTPGHLHTLAGAGVSSVSVGSGSVVEMTAGGGSTSSEGTLSVEVPGGATGSLVVLDNNPYTTWFTGYCHRAKHVPLTTTFDDVTSGVQVTPSVEGPDIALTITPFISYHAASGAGTVSFREASKKLKVLPGGTATVTAVSSKGQQIYRYIFAQLSPHTNDFLTIVPQVAGH